MSPIALASLLAVLPLQQVAPEDEPNPDSTFGNLGRIVIEPEGSAQSADASAVVPAGDGGYWVPFASGPTMADPSMPPDLLLRRLDAAGNAISGSVATVIDGYPISSFVDGAGRLVVAVSVPGPAFDVVARFLPTGLPDGSFGVGGVWVSPGDGRIFDVAPAPGDAIWVSRTTSPMFANVELLRVTAGGQLDQTFAPITDQQLGEVPLNHAPLDVDAQGKLVWAPIGFGDSPGLLVRLTSAGVLENVRSFVSRCGSVANQNLTDVAILPGGTAIVRWRVGSDIVGTVAVPQGEPPGPVACETNPAQALGIGIVARDASSYFVAGSNCTQSGCGPSFRRFLVASGGTTTPDPAFDELPTIQIFDNGASDHAIDLAVDAGKPVVLGSFVRTDGGRSVAVIRYGGTNTIFRNGFEE
jgi:hypothetical protein